MFLRTTALMSQRRKHHKAKKASLIAFGLIALAAVTSGTNSENVLSVNEAPDQVVDHTAEAARAYKQAMSTLTVLSNLPPAQAHERQGSGAFSSLTSPNSLLSSFLPNIQGQGPIASAMRIALRLRHQQWLPNFLNNYINKESVFARRRDEELRVRAVKVLDLLQHASDLGHNDALYTLAHISLFPPNSYFPHDPSLSFTLFDQHASTTGNATSQAILGFLYATGYHDIVPVDQAKAQLYLTFAAHGGHRGAQMALGYRYWSGIAVAEDCMSALSWYEDAAEQAMAKFMTGPPGGRTLPLVSPRLSDLEGGVYGPGASVASTGLNAGRAVIKTANARAAGETWEDLLEYYLFNADRGEVDFAYRLGKIFYHGSIHTSPGGIASGGDGAGPVPRDFHRARHYFLRIARQVWPSDPANPRHIQHASKEDSPPTAGYASLAAGYLGRMYLRGEGVKQDTILARMWFERGADYSDKESHNGLGIIWRDGLVDGKVDIKKALAHFGAAASQDLAEAHVQLGKYHWSVGDIKMATVYFEQAVRLGSPFEPYYYLAELQSKQAKNTLIPRNIAGSSCAIAVSFYKLVAERGSWDEDLVRDGETHWRLGTDRGREMAMLRWWLASERGYEVAQNNLAFVLDQDKSVLRFTRFSPISPSNDTARLALTQWIRSAGQRNVDSLVKVGDYYYHGFGVLEESESVRFEKAVGYYQSAADTQMSALAMWNLGYMYENGIGVPQDFHLAKRHYDLALETNQEAYLPIVLSLIKLYARSIWHTMLGGTEGLDIWGDDAESGQSYYADHENRGIDDGHRSDGRQTTGKDGSPDEDQDGSWYIGKARDDFNRRQRGPDQGAPVNDNDDDPVQWARDRRQAENDRDSDFGPEDYFDAAMRGGHRGEEDVDDFGETMLLLVLCIAVSTLLFIRGRWVERMRREQEEQQRQQQPGAQGAQGGGLYPPPGNPARNDWAILR